jgi:hypothetical protein
MAIAARHNSRNYSGDSGGVEGGAFLTAGKKTQFRVAIVMERT